MKATLISAVLNCVLNFYFIPKFNYFGAAVTTLISEGFVFLFCFIRIKNKSEHMDVSKIKGNIGQALLGVVIMMIYAYAVRYFAESYVMHIVLIVPGCIVIYFVVLLLFKNQYLIDNLMLIKKKFFKR